MILYLSGLLSESNDFLDKLDLSKISTLQAFPYMSNNKIDYINKFNNFILDSGAFTMMNKNNKNFDITEYVKKYGKFVKDNDIDNFFELDVDGVYGFDVYKDCLYRLQDISGKDPIRVYHTWRGLDYFDEVTKNKDIIAIGGIAVKQIRSKDYDMFIKLINNAHKNNCKIHGLGLTSSSNLRRFNFDSVDSSRWIMARRFARCQRFDGHSINSVGICESGTSYKDENIMLHNFKYWVEYSKYLEQF